MAGTLMLEVSPCDNGLICRWHWSVESTWHTQVFENEFPDTAANTEKKFTDWVGTKMADARATKQGGGGGSTYAPPGHKWENGNLVQDPSQMDEHTMPSDFSAQQQADPSKWRPPTR